MSVSGIRRAIAEALEAVSGLRIYQTAPESVNELPAAYILPRIGTYDFTMGGASMVHQFEVIVLVSKGGSLAEAQETLDKYLDPTGTDSIKEAIEDADLGTDADTIRVDGYRDYGGLEYGGTPYIGCKFDISVWV